jgi:hypothetical protein
MTHTDVVLKAQSLMNDSRSRELIAVADKEKERSHVLSLIKSLVEVLDFSSYVEAQLFISEISTHLSDGNSSQYNSLCLWLRSIVFSKVNF